MRVVPQSRRPSQAVGYGLIAKSADWRGRRLLPAGPIARNRGHRSTRPVRPRLIETIGLALPGQFRSEVLKKWNGLPLTPYDGLAILGSRPYREVPKERQ